MNDTDFKHLKDLAEKHGGEAEKVLEGAYDGTFHKFHLSSTSSLQTAATLPTKPSYSDVLTFSHIRYQGSPEEANGGSKEGCRGSQGRREEGDQEVTRFISGVRGRICNLSVCAWILDNSRVCTSQIELQEEIKVLRRWRKFSFSSATCCDLKKVETPHWRFLEPLVITN